LIKKHNTDVVQKQWGLRSNYFFYGSTGFCTGKVA
jgi:hypothetical protein